jgi:hypothetical protein
MFFLSSGILETIKHRGFIHGQSINYTDATTNISRIILRNYEKPAIVRVEDIRIIRDNSIVLVNLFDGKSKMDIQLEKNLWKNLGDFKEFFGTDNVESIVDEKMIKRGSILIMSEYTFQDIYVSENDKIEDIIVLLNYSVLGLDNSRENNNNETPVTKNSFFLIKNINTNLNNINWNITAKLLKKSIVKDFVNKLTGYQGQFIRIQFTDESGIIEVVAFNNEIEKCNNLVENRIYDIINADVKNSNTNYQAFDESNISKFELMVNKKTSFNEALIDESSFKIFILPKKQEVTVTVDTFKINKNDKYKHLSSINDLKFKKEGEVVNIIAVIVGIDDLKEVTPKFKPTINLRNIYITDQSEERMKVALWGKQASEFSNKLGEILIFSKLKLKNYQGLFLQVEWESLFSLIEIKWDDEISGALRKWWKDKNEEEISSSLKRTATFTDLSNINEKKPKE